MKQIMWQTVENYLNKEELNMPLKEIREQRQLSQSQLARMSGVSIKTIQAYEQGTKNIDHARLKTLLKLSITLRCSIDEILIDEVLKDLFISLKVNQI